MRGRLVAVERETNRVHLKQGGQGRLPGGGGISSVIRN